MTALFLIVFIFGGSYAIGHAIFYYRKAQKSKGWPTALGKILSSSVLEKSHGEDGKRYSPEIHYEYTVNGERLLGNVWRFGAGQSSCDSAESVVAKYPPGRTIMVHFNASNPAEAVLEPVPASGTPFFFGVAFLCVALWISWATIRLELKAAKASAWPSIPGKILRSSIHEGHDSDNDTTYTPEIHYEYRVNGDSRHFGHVWKFNETGSSGDRSAVQKIVEKYPPGLAVNVFVNPNNADEAVLEVDGDFGGPGWTRLVIFALVVLLGGAWPACSYTIKKRFRNTVT